MPDPWAKGWANRLAGVFGDGPAVSEPDDEEAAKSPAPPTPAFPFSGVKATLAPPAQRPRGAPGLPSGMAAKMGDALVDGPGVEAPATPPRQEGLVRISDVAKPPSPETMRNLATLAARDAGERYRRGESVEVNAATMPWLAQEGAFGDAQKTNPDGSISVDAESVGEDFILKPGKSDAQRIAGFDARGRLQTPEDLGRVSEMSTQEAFDLAARYHPELLGPPKPTADHPQGLLGDVPGKLAAKPFFGAASRREDPRFNAKPPTSDLSPLEKIGLKYNPMAAPFVAGYELFRGDDEEPFDPDRKMPISFANIGRKITELPGAINEELARAGDATLVDVGEGIGADKWRTQWDPLGFGTGDDMGAFEALGKGVQAIPNEIMGLMAMPFDIAEAVGSPESGSKFLKGAEGIVGDIAALPVRTVSNPRRTFSEGPIGMAMGLSMTGLPGKIKGARAARRAEIKVLEDARYEFESKATKQVQDLMARVKEAGKSPDAAATSLMLDDMVRATNTELINGVDALSAKINKLKSPATSEGAAQALGSLGLFVANPLFGVLDVLDLAKTRLYGKRGGAETRYLTLPLEQRAEAELLNAVRTANSSVGAAEVKIRTALDLLPDEAKPVLFDYLRMEDKAGVVFDIGNKANNLVEFDPKVPNPIDPALRGAWVLTEKGKSAAPELSKKIAGQLQVANRWGGSLADLVTRYTDKARELGMFYDPEALLSLYAPDVYRSPRLLKKAQRDLEARRAARLKSAGRGKYTAALEENMVAEKTRRPTTELGGIDGSEFRANERRQNAKQWAADNPNRPMSENPFRAERYERQYGLRTDADGWIQGIVRFVHDVEMTEKVWNKLGMDPKQAITKEQYALLPAESKKGWILVPEDSVGGVKQGVDAWRAKQNERLAAEEAAAFKARGDAYKEVAAGERVIRGVEKRPVSPEAAALAEQMAAELGIPMQDAIELVKSEAEVLKGDAKAARSGLDSARGAVKTAEEARAAANEARKSPVTRGPDAVAEHKARVAERNAAVAARGEAAGAVKSLEAQQSIAEDALRKAAYDEAVAKRPARVEAAQAAEARIAEIKAEKADVRAKKAPRRYGEAAGKYMREDVVVELANVQRLAQDAGLRITNMVKHWKSWKTAYSPTTTARNLLTNVFLFAPMAGISPFNPANWPYYAKALYDMTLPMGKRSEQWKRLYEKQAFSGTHYRSELAGTTELAPLRGGLQSVKDLVEVMPMSVLEMAMGGGNGIRSRAWRRFAESTVGNFGRVYGAMDDLFRAAYGYKFESKFGTEAAALAARKNFIDYDAVSGFVNVLRQPFSPYSRTSTALERGTGFARGSEAAFFLAGQPFLAFTARAIPLFAEWVQANPVMGAAYEALYNHLSDAAAAAQGLDVGVERDKVAALPFYERARVVNMATMPAGVRDAIVGDLEPPLTRTSVGMERPDQLMNIMWASPMDYVAPQNMQFSSGLDQAVDFAGQKLLGSGFPLWQLFTEVLDNKSKYANQAVRKTGAGVGWGDQVVQILDYMYQKVAPPIAPSLTDITDRIGLTNQHELGAGDFIGLVPPEEADAETMVLRAGTPTGLQTPRMKAGQFWEDRIAADEGRPDWRGRVKRPETAALGSWGAKVTERLPTESIAQFSKVYMHQLGQSQQNVLDNLAKSKAAVAVDPRLTRLVRRTNATAAVPLVQELVRGVAPYMAVLNDDGTQVRGREQRNARSTVHANAIWNAGQRFLEAMKAGRQDEAAGALDALSRVIRRQLGQEAQVPEMRAMDALNED